MKLEIAHGALLATAFFSASGTVYGQGTEVHAPSPIVVSVDTQKTAPPVSKYEFGMFIEHLRTLIYRSLWSEMVDDRKFYFPISSTEPDAPTQQQVGPARNIQLRKWRPVGPDEVVVMDKDQPFVGDQSPRIELDSSTPHGIRQSGLGLVKGKKYTGRIYLRGTPGSKVKVSLIWGDGESDRQTIVFAALTNEYKRLALNFTSRGDASAASFEVTGTGTGNFHIGAVSLMPADNMQGFRPDTVAFAASTSFGHMAPAGREFPF